MCFTSQNELITLQEDNEKDLQVEVETECKNQTECTPNNLICHALFNYTEQPPELIEIGCMYKNTPFRVSDFASKEEVKLSGPVSIH